MPTGIADLITELDWLEAEITAVDRRIAAALKRIKEWTWV
jgi:hypothetical protein